LLPVFSLVTSGAMLAFTIVYSSYGFDLTDEGFYFLWLAEPAAYSIHIPVSFFGFVYHPIYNFLGGDAVALRRVNVLVTFGVTWLLSVVLMRQLLPHSNTKSISFAAMTAGIATTSLTYFALWWLVTPSYNSLTLQGMMLTFTGLAIAINYYSWQRLLGWVCIGVGGWLVFLAKPSTAALLAPAVLACLMASGRRNYLAICGSASLAASLTLACAIAIDGSIRGFFNRVLNSIGMLDLLGSGQEFNKIFRIDNMNLSSREQMIMILIILMIIVGALALRRWFMLSQVFTVSGFFLAPIVVAYLLWPNAPALGFRGVVLFSVPAGAILFIALFEWRELKSLRPMIPLALLLLVAPHIYAFGTNGNYWSHGSAAGFFWVASGLVFLTPLLRQSSDVSLLCALVVLLQGVCAPLLVQAVKAPYRQESFFSDNYVDWNLRDQGNVLVSNGFRDYLAEVRSVVEQAGFAAGNPMIDLTGRSPGLLYDLKARSPGQPWFVGSYSGSDALAIATLNGESCATLANAWLLVEPGGPRSLDESEVTQSFGANLVSDYVLAGSFKTAAGAGGYAERYSQRILKPSRVAQEAIEACERARPSVHQEAP
jgi:hypothetical protein